MSESLSFSFLPLVSCIMSPPIGGKQEVTCMTGSTSTLFV